MEIQNFKEWPVYSYTLQDTTSLSFPVHTLIKYVLFHLPQIKIFSSLTPSPPPFLPLGTLSAGNGCSTAAFFPHAIRRWYSWPTLGEVSQSTRSLIGTKEIKAGPERQTLSFPNNLQLGNLSCSSVEPRLFPSSSAAEHATLFTSSTLFMCNKQKRGRVITQCFQRLLLSGECRLLGSRHLWMHRVMHNRKASSIISDEMNEIWR